jgi:hypothetical protein
VTTFLLALATLGDVTQIEPFQIIFVLAKVAQTGAVSTTAVAGVLAKHLASVNTT